MIVAIALVVGGVVIAWTAHAPLGKLTGLTRDPGLPLTSWLALQVAVVGSLAAGAVLLVLGEHTHVHSGLWHSCWAILGHDHLHPIDEITGVLLLGLLVVACIRIWRLARRGMRKQRRAHRAHLAVLRAAGSPAVLWMAHDRPFAYSIAGRPGIVVASTAVANLPAGHRDAVLAHERHHLRARHHLLLIAVRAMSRALPRVPLFRSAALQIEALAEASADTQASRSCGAEAMRAALAAMDDKTAVRQRLRYLKRPVAGTRARVIAARIAAAFTSTLSPPVLGIVIVGLLTAIVC